MKRYWFSILLSVFIVVGTGTYYIFGTNEQLPEYRLTTVQGDEKEGAAILLEGFYMEKYRTKHLNITTKGSFSPSDQPLYRQISNSWSNQFPSDIRQIIQDHRSFMRGKERHYNGGLYKDDNIIISVEAVVRNKDVTKPQLALRIEILDQESGKTIHYETVLDNLTYYTYSHVADVQVIDNEIHILTMQIPGELDKFQNVGGESSEQYRYNIVDMKSGILRGDEILDFGIPTADDMELYYNSITHAVLSAPSDYALFTVQEKKQIERDENYQEKLVDKHMYSFNYRTGKLKEIPALQHADKNYEQGAYQLEYLQDNVLTTLILDSNLITWSRYNIDTEKLEPSNFTLTPPQLGADAIIESRFIQGDQLYILYSKDQIPMTAIVNTSNGDVVYKGQVVSDGEASDSMEPIKKIELRNIQAIE
ncbi:hypothetical protein [Paenibacillus sp. CMAA1364]